MTIIACRQMQSFATTDWFIVESQLRERVRYQFFMFLLKLLKLFLIKLLIEFIIQRNFIHFIGTIDHKRPIRMIFSSF